MGNNAYVGQEVLRHRRKGLADDLSVLVCELAASVAAFHGHVDELVALVHLGNPPSHVQAGGRLKLKQQKTMGWKGSKA